MLFCTKIRQTFTLFIWIMLQLFPQACLHAVFTPHPLIWKISSQKTSPSLISSKQKKNYFTPVILNAASPANSVILIQYHGLNPYYLMTCILKIVKASPQTEVSNFTSKLLYYTTFSNLKHLINLMFLLNAFFKITIVKVVFLFFLL